MPLEERGQEYNQKVTHKKGLSLSDLYPAVIAILLVGMVIGIGIFILTQTSNSISQELTTVVNETVAVTSAPTLVADATECGFSLFTIITVFNITNDVLLTDTNWSSDSTSGRIWNNDVSIFNDTEWKVTYTYLGASGNSYCSVLDTTGSGVGELADWIVVIVIVIAAAIVLAVILGSFGGRKAISSV